MIRNQIFTIARAACHPDDNQHCQQVVSLLEEMVYISSRTLRNSILLANRYLQVNIDRRQLEKSVKSDMEQLARHIRTVNQLCQDFDCDDLGALEADEFADRFMEEIISSRKQMC